MPEGLDVAFTACVHLWYDISTTIRPRLFDTTLTRWSLIALGNLLIVRIVSKGDLFKSCSSASAEHNSINTNHVLLHVNLAAWTWDTSWEPRTLQPCCLCWTTDRISELGRTSSAIRVLALHPPNESMSFGLTTFMKSCSFKVMCNLGCRVTGAL